MADKDQMGFVGRHRIAQRYDVATTPIDWQVAKRGKRPERAKRVWAEAALIEVSIMGCAIVAPSMWGAPIGSKVPVRWEGHEGLVLVRRTVPFRGTDTYVLYGVEYADSQSGLGAALYDHFVVEPGREEARLAAAAAAAEQAAYEATFEDDRSAPAVWAGPNVWPERG